MIDRCYIEITNVCNLDCDFCPKHSRSRRLMSLDEFELVTDRIRDRVCFVYFHLMGEPMLHPQLPQFIRIARDKGFKTVLTSNGTLLDRAMDLLDSLPHKVQLSLHSHEGNARSGSLQEYADRVMQFATRAAGQGTCVVLRLWNQGGKSAENDAIVQMLEQYVPRPWRERPDGFRMCDNLYLEFDRKFKWPNDDNQNLETSSDRNIEISNNQNIEISKNREIGKPQYFCKALLKQIGVLADGTLVPCCLDHNGNVALGNLFQQTLDEILNSPRAQALVKGFEHHAAVEPLCQNCESALARNSFRGHKRS